MIGEIEFGGRRGFRVMSRQEYARARNGLWEDGPYAGEAFETGLKWLWLTFEDAVRWRDYLESNGEVELIIAEVVTLKPIRGYHVFDHIVPPGSAVLVPISDLGKARQIPDDQV